MKIIDGKLVAKQLKSKIKEEIERDFISKNKRPPCLACIIVEGNSASEIYVASKQKACSAVGIKSKVIRLAENVSREELYKNIDELNKDKEVSGILLQLPLPKHLDENEAINRILPEKDVDCLTSKNLGALLAKQGKIAPCTAEGIMELLKSENIEVEGKRAVVVGRSLLVGKSSAVLLEEANATVTICHSKTQNLKSVTKEADILVVAIGKREMIDKDYIKKGAVVIDVGINRTEEGIKGDVNFAEAKSKCSYITPVPGGVGPMTVACLLKNTLTLHKLYN